MIFSLINIIISIIVIITVYRYSQQLLYRHADGQRTFQKALILPRSRTAASCLLLTTVPPLRDTKPEFMCVSRFFP